MSDERERLAHRIRSLLAMTEDNGCTEAEAMAAAQKARELMDAHRLTMTDLEIRSEEIIDGQMATGNKSRWTPADHAFGGIKRYCGVKCWFTSGGRYSSQGKRVHFFGLKSDVEMAQYLYTLINGAVRVELATYQKQRGFADRSETSSFQYAMALRISSRLTEMARERDPVAKTASGTTLVVVKNAVVEDAYAKLGLRLKSAGSGSYSHSASAYEAGRAAGDRVNLSRPVAGNGSQQRLR